MITEREQLRVVKQDGWAIDYIKNPTAKVKELAKIIQAIEKL